MENVGIFKGHLVYLQLFGIFYARLVHFVFIWYIFSRFGIMYLEKSGNPGWDAFNDLSTLAYVIQISRYDSSSVRTKKKRFASFFAATVKNYLHAIVILLHVQVLCF
jgi:hypothetical protein